MLKQIPLKDQVGKKLTFFQNQYGIAIAVFNDTFYFISEIDDINLLDCPDLAIESGVITVEELNKLKEDRDNRNEKIIKKNRIQQYEALKREFGE